MDFKGAEREIESNWILTERGRDRRTERVGNWILRGGGD